MTDYISREAVRLIESDSEAYAEAWNASYEQGFCDGINAVLELPAADAVPVVRCRECVNYVESVEANGEKMCVKDADWCVEDGCYYGFTDYPAPDWFCADGKRKDGADNG